jgi:quercetin dioxygenase-like cupin family protein
MYYIIQGDEYMIIDFNKLDMNKQEKMRNGEGYVGIQKYNDPNKMIAKITIPPQSSIGFHTHVEDEEIVYVIEGNGTCIDGENKRNIKTGDVNFTRKGESHSIINTSDFDLVILAIINK